MLNQPGPEKKSHSRITSKSTSGRYKNSESQLSGDVALIFRIAIVVMAISSTKASSAHATGVSAPKISSKPQTNSTAETNTALNSAKGTCASINVWRICSLRSGAKSLPRPERKNSKPTIDRANRIPSHCHACNSLTKSRTHDIDRGWNLNYHTSRKAAAVHCGLCRDKTG